ncbi:MAG: hypothetical protein WCE43_12010 [Burkholderiales bacterium]
MKLYQSEDTMKFDDRVPDMLAIGDSWFSYPLPPHGNILNQLSNKFSGSKTLLNTAINGANIIDIINKSKSCQTLIDNLSGYPTIKVLLISGGGNDLLHGVVSMLLNDCSAALTAADCFAPGQPDLLLDKIKNAFRDLALLRDTHRPNATIVAHGYDYAKPNGLSFLLGPSLKPALDHVKVPTALGESVIRILIDGLALRLAQMETETNHFIFVPTAGTLTQNDDWADERHPSLQGIKKLVAKIEPVLQPFLSR